MDHDILAVFHQLPAEAFPLLLERLKPAILFCHPHLQKETAGPDPPLAVALCRVHCLFHGDQRICIHPPVKSSLRRHHVLCPLSMSLCQAVIIRHALIHLVHFPVKGSAAAVIQPQYRRRTKRPAVGGIKRHRLLPHQASRFPVKDAHSGDLVVFQEAHIHIKFTEILVSLFFVDIFRLFHAGKEKFLHLHHLRHHSKEKEPPHADDLSQIMLL